MRPLIALLIVLSLPMATALPIPILAPACDGHDDAGSGRDATRSNPVIIPLGESHGCAGWVTIGEDDGEDWFELVVPGEQMSLTLSWEGCTSLRLYLYLIGEDGHPIMRSGVESSNACTTQTLTDSAAEGGATFLVLVDLPGRQEGQPYALLAQTGVELTGPCGPQDDNGSGRDATWERPVPIAANLGRASGCLDNIDQEDLFRLTLPEGGRVRFEVDVRSGQECGWFESFQLMVWSVDGDEEAYFTSHLCEDLLGGTQLPAGDYDVYLSYMKREEPWVVDYGLLIESGDLQGRCGEPNDAGTGRDATSAAPLALGWNERTISCVDEFDPHDLFTLSVPAGTAFTLKVEPTQGCWTPFLGVDPEGDGITSAHRYGCGGTYAFRAGSAATWRFHLISSDYDVIESNPYALTFDVCENAPPPPVRAADACGLGAAITDASETLGAIEIEEILERG